jgi:ectoine hydroxylase-related dioxygenase (phytanoyl-CoA dioxygenase family)
MQVLSVGEVVDLKRALDDEGFVVVRDVVPRDRLAELAAGLADEYERASSNGELFRGGGTLSGHLNCFPGAGSRFVYEAIEARGIVDVARAVDPAKADAIRVTLNYNLPGSRPQFYHTDDLFTEAFLICNIAVVDTDLSNGAIDVLPATHKKFYRFWQYAVQRKYRLSARVCLQQGDVLLRMSTLWHRGMPNTTSVPRPMMSITFGEKSAPAGDPFGANDGKITYYPNWFTPSRIGRARERTFVAMPWTYSTYRFTRSLFSDRGNSSW